DQADRPPQAVDTPMQLPPGGLPPDWSELAPEIAALPAASVITKRQWGAFHGTELDLQLRRRGITTIVLGGIATNFGVESTAREAWQHNYAVVVAEDACTSLGEDLHRFSIEKVLPRVARVRKAAEIMSALQLAEASPSGLQKRRRRGTRRSRSLSPVTPAKAGVQGRAASTLPV